MSKQESLKQAQNQLAQAVDEREQAYAQMAREQDEYREFLYVASHDLQAPLRKIKAFCERLHAHAGGQLDSKSLHYLDRMQVATERMQYMLDALLLLSRVNSRELKPETIELTPFLDALAKQRKFAQGKPAAEIVVDTGELAVCCDATQAELLFEELLKNALEHPRDGEPARVRISASRDANGRIDVEVADEGRGFDPAGAEAAFNMFHRLHRPVDDAPGCGAGLTICRRIIERHGGKISATAEPGGGARIHFSLPAA